MGCAFWLITGSECLVVINRNNIWFPHSKELEFWWFRIGFVCFRIVRWPIKIVARIWSAFFNVIEMWRRYTGMSYFSICHDTFKQLLRPSLLSVSLYILYTRDLLAAGHCCEFKNYSQNPKRNQNSRSRECATRSSNMFRWICCVHQTSFDRGFIWIVTYIGAKLVSAHMGTFGSESENHLLSLYNTNTRFFYPPHHWFEIGN